VAVVCQEIVDEDKPFVDEDKLIVEEDKSIVDEDRLIVDVDQLIVVVDQLIVGADEATVDKDKCTEADILAEGWAVKVGLLPLYPSIPVEANVGRFEEVKEEGEAVAVVVLESTGEQDFSIPLHLWH
jgi:hypothetical protein